MVRPELSTNWQSIVWIRLGFGEGNGWGVGTLGIEDISRNKSVCEWSRPHTMKFYRSNHFACLVLFSYELLTDKALMT